MANTPARSAVDRLLEHLRTELGDGLRSCVEYTPQSSTIHYLRADIEETQAKGRLVRIAELYHAERLSATPCVEDPALGALRASVHLFEQAVVVHLVDAAGTVIGFSIDPGVKADALAFVTDAIEAAYGSDGRASPDTGEGQSRNGTA